MTLGASMPSCICGTLQRSSRPACSPHHLRNQSQGIDSPRRTRPQSRREAVRLHVFLQRVWRLPDFKCAWDARRGAQQLAELFRKLDMTQEVFQCRTFTRLKQLEYPIRTQQIDEHFFWKE